MQKSSNVDESCTTSCEVASSPATPVSLSTTGWWEDFDDDNGDDMDLEELGKALSEAGIFASHSKKTQINHHSETVVKTMPVSTRTRTRDSNIPGIVMTCKYTYVGTFCIVLPICFILCV